jgi:hypothetical protein
MRQFLRSILYLWSVAVGLWCALTLYWPGLIPLTFGFLSTPQGRITLGVVAGLLLSSPFMILLRWVQALRRNREISYTTDSGKISVSLIAIEEALTRAVEGEAEVKKAHVRVFEDRVRRAVVVEAVVTMWEVPNVTDRNKFLQKLLRRRFAELMPEQQSVDVNLHLHRMTERRPDEKPAAVAAAGAEAGVGSGSGPAVPVRRADTDELDPPAHEANPMQEPSEEDLFVGPAYPVPAEDEDESQTYRPSPRQRAAKERRR